jgi:hypothetical protein
MLLVAGSALPSHAALLHPWGAPFSPRLQGNIDI